MVVKMQHRFKLRIILVGHGKGKGNKEKIFGVCLFDFCVKIV